MSPQLHNLLNPIKLKNGNELKSVSMRLYTLGEYEQHADKERQEQVDELGALICGIESDDFENLCAPDYNTICDYVLRQQSETSEQFLSKKLNPERPDLLQLIVSDEGKTLGSLELVIPTVKAIRMRNKQSELPLVRAQWLTAHCTGLGINDMKKLSMPDWMYLQSRLGDFLLKPAAFFRSGTSNS